MSKLKINFHVWDKLWEDRFIYRKVSIIYGESKKPSIKTSMKLWGKYQLGDDDKLKKKESSYFLLNFILLNMFMG